MTVRDTPETPATRHLRLVHERQLESEPSAVAPPPPPTRPKSTGAALWVRFKRLRQFGWPRSFPLVQFPNAPLIIAFLAGQAAGLAHGSAHADATAISYLAMTIWAYEELAHGVNWFRHLLGLAYLLSTLAHLALVLRR
jgi:hypothetical protein